MYLTRFAINPARRASRELLASPQKLHAAVLGGFPPQDAGATAPGRVLWRLDERAEHRRDLLVVSPAPPDLTHLVEQAGWPTAATWETRDYRGLLGRLDAGQRWVFRLSANPVRSIRSTPEGRTKPVAHVTAAQQTSWLLDRCGRNGFAVLPSGEAGESQVSVVDRRTLRFGRQGKTVTVARATFDGVLEVTDPDLLRRALTEGIGRARAYGCGLLSLAPPV